MKDEIIVIPVELNELAKNSQIKDLTKAEKIAMSFAPSMNEVNEQVQLFKKLKKGNVEDVVKAKRIRLDLGKICSKAGDIKKANKEVVSLEVKLIDSLYNAVNTTARLAQEEVKEIENHFVKIEAEKLEKTRLERIDKLEPYKEYVPFGVDLSILSDEDFEKVFTGSKMQFDAKVAADLKAEQDAKNEAEKLEKERIEKERLQEVHNKRKNLLVNSGLWNFRESWLESECLSEIVDKKWDELISNLKTKQTEFENDQKRIEEENENLRIKNEAIEKKAKKDREEAEKLRLASEAKASAEKKIQDAILEKGKEKQKKLQEEIDRKAKEEKEAETKRLADIELELKKGDSDKVLDLINDLTELKSKYIFKSEKFQKAYSDTGLLIDKVINHINK